MSERGSFRVAVLATDGLEEPKLAEPGKGLREAGARVTILAPQPAEIQGVRPDIDKTIEVKVLASSKTPAPTISTWSSSPAAR
jgi:hypothetical protein